MSKAYWINSETQKISEVTVNGLADLQRLVGGHIELAYEWPSGDVLFVDEEGLLKRPRRGFYLLPERADQPLAGNGVIVGPETTDDEDQLPDPTINAAQLAQHILWWSA